MILQSIQSKAVVETLQENGIVFAHPVYEFEEDEASSWGFKESYEWLKQKMIEHNIVPHHNEKDMFWAWAYSGHRGQKKVDLRSIRHFNKGSYLLEIEKKDEEVLLSDYENWHHVLNYWPLVVSQEEEFFWENNSHPFYEHKPLVEKILHQKLTASWNKVLSLKEVQGAYQYDLPFAEQQYLEVINKKIITQATFWNIKMNEVKTIRQIK